MNMCNVYKINQECIVQYQPVTKRCLTFSIVKYYECMHRIDYELCIVMYYECMF